MVEVFRTNVQEVSVSEMIIKKLLVCYPESCVTFDLDDCDKVLRIKNETVCVQQVIALLNDFGYYCDVLI